jgi:beta-galactosidase
MRAVAATGGFMRGRSVLSAIALLGVFWLAVADRADGGTRVMCDLSQDWRFLRADEAGAESPDYLRDSKWQSVRLPHTWNTKDVFDEEPGYYRGIGWYRKKFAVPADWVGRRIVVRFEAACQVATVWVNGRLLGEHKGSWTPFEFDVTDLVKPGSNDNLLAVRVDNRRRRDVPPHDMDFNIMGGLHREVCLVAMDPVYIVSVQVTTPRVSESEGTVQWLADVSNQSGETQTVEVFGELSGPGLAKPIVAGAPAVRLAPGQSGRFTQEMPSLPTPRLWLPDEPNLYQIAFHARVGSRVVDDQQCPVGFRWFRFDAEQGFFLNGKHLKLHGVNRHDDYPGLGWALPTARHVADLELIKRLGANIVRTAHYAQHPVVLETCDRLGLFVWEEAPFDGECRGRMPIAGASDYGRTLKQNLRETLLRDRNHPCILVWGLGNENLDGGPIEKEGPAVVGLTRELKRIVQEMDPTRPTGVAINKIDKAEVSGLVDVTDVVGLNMYLGWYSGRVEDFEKTIDAFHRRHPDRPLVITEYGADSERGRHTFAPRRRDVSEEYACLFHEHYWQAINARPYAAGSFVWNVFDFAAEHRVKDQSIPHMNQKGLFTYAREPKDVYYHYLSQWSREPMVYIVSHTWTDRPKGSAPIRVYGNGERVELFANGKSLGVKRQGEPLVWNMTLASGNNELRAEARRGAKTTSDILCIQAK